MQPDQEEFFRILLHLEDEDEQHRAPARMKARIYSALIREQQKTGSLQSISETERNGHSLCVFEKVVQMTPVGERAKSTFFCWTCHARLLGENVERAPIFWPSCPYAAFHRR